MDSSITHRAQDANGATHAENRRHALDLLLFAADRSVPSRRPGSTGRDLELILDLGLRAPDHGRLRTSWRFVLIRGDARRQPSPTDCPWRQPAAEILRRRRRCSTAIGPGRYARRC